MLDLKQFVRESIEKDWHCGGPETAADNAVIQAINQRGGKAADRKKSVVVWLTRYSVFMGFSAESRTSIAGEVIRYADGRLGESLHGNKNRIISEFIRLTGRIRTAAPRNGTGKERVVTSLASKALWCCYPNDVPIFDRNALNALRIISRLCNLAPQPDPSEYACFVDVWLRVYDEVESVIDEADQSDCPYKVRVLDRLLWRLGQNSFHN